MKPVYEFLADRTHTCTVLNYRGPKERLDAIRSRLGNHGISTRLDRSGSGDPPNVALFHRGDSLVDAVSIDEWWTENPEFDGLLEDDDRGEPEARVPPAAASSITVSKETTRRRLTGISREFERRALRHGEGTLAVGFQYLSVLTESRRTHQVYRRLTDAGVDVTVHGYPDAEIEGVPYAVVPDEAEQFKNYWFMFYDAAGEADRTAVLVARETDAGVYDGYWSVDADTVQSAFELAVNEYPSLVAPEH